MSDPKLPPLDLAPLPTHMTQRGGSGELLWLELRHVIEQAIINDPRSLQTEIGPSGIGDPCTRCLANALAGIKTERGDTQWLPFIGRCVHAGLADIFMAENTRLGFTRYLVEQRVYVGDVDGRRIYGSCDVFDRVTAASVDWKIVGASTLKKAKGGPGESYRVQGHTYGDGWVNRGLEVDQIGVMFLPRNAMSLRDAVRWFEPYDPSVSAAARKRADALAKAVRVVGLDKVLAQHPGHHPGCFNSDREDPMTDLLGRTA